MRPGPNFVEFLKARPADAGVLADVADTKRLFGVLKGAMVQLGQRPAAGAERRHRHLLPPPRRHPGRENPAPRPAAHVAALPRRCRAVAAAHAAEPDAAHGRSALYLGQSPGKDRRLPLPHLRPVPPQRKTHARRATAPALALERLAGPDRAGRRLRHHVHHRQRHEQLARQAHGQGRPAGPLVHDDVSAGNPAPGPRTSGRG